MAGQPPTTMAPHEDGMRRPESQQQDDHLNSPSDHVEGAQGGVTNGSSSVTPMLIPGDQRHDAIQHQSHDPSPLTSVQQNKASQTLATSSTDSIAPVKSKKRKTEADKSTQPPPKQAKTSTAKKTTSGSLNSKVKANVNVKAKAKVNVKAKAKVNVKTKANVKAKAKTSSSGGDDNTSSEADLPPSDEKPLYNLREIIADLLERSQSDGLNHYVQSGRQFFIRVGTLCSGTDAPIHVMDLFGMLKNDQGSQVFTTINSFGCEIEPFKQGFLMRNSKPQLLFRDARDFAKEGASQAHLVTGTEAAIPQVDLFIAGTSCVDFSSLNSRKSKAFAGLAVENKNWQILKEKHGDQLSLCHLSRESWRKAIDSMMEASGSRNTSTTTFASAMNYIFEHQPKIVIFENVESAPWDSVVKYVFPLCGYATKILRLDTKLFYLPQTRSRKYLIAFSHSAFTLEGAQALADSVGTATENLKRMHSSSVTDFLLAMNSLELQRARNEMELMSQARRDRDTDWSFSRSRHMAFRRHHTLPDKRLWIRWKDNGSSNPPAKMWKPWEDRQPKRVSDLLECIYLLARYGTDQPARYDLAFKAQIIDCSQNVDRIDIKPCFGRTGCLTPSAIPVLALEARPVTGSESLKLQGLPIENFDMSVETQEQLQNLAGNAMSTTVVGATILASLQCVAKTARALGLDWLETMFQQGDYKHVHVISNSFQNNSTNLDHGSREELWELKLFAHLQPKENVQEILELGQQTRRRCYCYHTLAYSSLELYVCIVCGASLCKSCKGNPEHHLIKSQQSLEQLQSLPFSKAEHAIRQYFPSILPFITGVDPSFLARLNQALLHSDYDACKRAILAQAILKGLCQSTYQLRFVEITDVTRVEYTAEPNFIVRIIVEKDKLVWYLLLNEWCELAEGLHEIHKTSRPIARAVVEQDNASQFPGSWEFWFPKKVKFPINLRLQADRKLRLERVGDLQDIPHIIQKPIKDLEQSVWTYHQECGFPEDAFWVSEDSKEKLFLFKDVDPVGPSEKDEFVISSISREMGRAPIAETRPVLLRISEEDQIHLKIKDMVHNNKDEDGSTIGDLIPLLAFIDGWWEDLEDHKIYMREFTGCMDAPWMQRFPASPPVDIRLATDTYDPSGPYASCHAYQDLLMMSLPILEAPEVLHKVTKTLRDLDLGRQLDFAEFAKLIGPCYFAVEQEIIKSGRHRILEKDVVLSADCVRCALKVPEVLFEKAEKARGSGARSIGPVASRHREQDRDAYNDMLQNRPSTLRIDHNVDPSLTAHPKKLHDVTYVDVCFVAHGHSLLNQARSYLAEHPAHCQDSVETRGTFALEVGVLEDPRIDLARIEIMPPTSVNQKDAKQPKGFRNGMELFPEQINSLNWMLEREQLKNPPSFVEKEMSEVYTDHLRLRVYAHAERNIVRRGGVVADDVGFGKTAVCLGLIASQHDTDRNEFLEMRKSNPHLQGMRHLHATLVIVPNQLTQQWNYEAKRFLKKIDRILIIQDFRQLQTLRLTDLETADIIICSSKVMHDTGEKYHKELLNYCGTNGIETKNLLALPRVYRVWYKSVHDVLRQVRGDALDILRVANSRAKSAKQQQDSALESLKANLDQIKDLRQANGGELRFVPSLASSTKWKPSMLLEFFSFSRLIWDEFPYENLPVTEFVANCATNSKWMLSGTPPLTTLGDICKVAYLFNVHLARPLSMVIGRQPPVCDHPPLEPLSDLETTITYKSRNSPPALQERHDQAMKFVKTFMRKNTRTMDLRAIESPIVLTASTTCSLAYMELQQELSSRTFNANLVAADPRRRLMSRVDWTGSKLGRERSTEALMLRASGSFQDVKEQTGHLALKAATSTIQEAEELYTISDSTIKAMEDRGRELLARAFYLGYRITFITISNTEINNKDNQEDRQLNYYQTLEDIIESILNVDLDLTSGWDAFDSAARMLIWDEEFLQDMHSYKEFGPDAVKDYIRAVFDNMEFCERPQLVPEPTDQPTSETRLKFLKLKQGYLEAFRNWLTKTPLHSRRSYLVNNVGELDEVEEELLEIEWKDKVPWEASYTSANDRGKRKVVVPISELRKPSSDVEIDDFDFKHLQATDKERREDMDAITEEVSDAQDRVTNDIASRPRKGRTDTKVFWKDESIRRGLQTKSADTLARMKKRVVADEAGIATDDDYLSPESCPLVIEDFPQEGTIRIRGGTMEDIFDRLMHTVDKLTVLFERLVIAHAKKNLQKVILDLVRGEWHCDQEHCEKSHNDHYVSLLCGHVLCGRPNDDATCGVRSCTHPVQDVCIPLSKVLAEPRVIKAADLEKGALAKDPAPYLDSSATPHGPKGRAVANLIDSVKDTDQIVVFVQSVAMMNDIYDALDSFGIPHIKPEELDANEAVALERFKMGRKKVLVQVINTEQAAGSNLHNANHVIFVSPLISRSQADWDSQMKQALGRCVRYRQNKTVYVYHLLMDGTIEVDTLEWRKKREILVRKGQAVGRLNDCSTLDFLDRFDGDETAAPVEMGEDEGRAVSLLPRTDIQVLMGDDYISLASARSKTIDGAAEVQEVEDDHGDVQMGEA